MATGAARDEPRVCLRCKKDLTDVMGCYVFVDGKPVDGLLCVEHGANGANNLSADEYKRLTAGIKCVRCTYLAIDQEDLGEHTFLVHG